MERLTIPQTLAEWNERGREYLPGHLGIEFLLVEPDEVRARMTVAREKCAWNGFLHAGAVVTLADTACGYATVRNLPEGRERLHDRRIEGKLSRHHARGRRRRRGDAGPQRPRHAGLGRGSARGADRQDDRAVPLHADDSARTRVTHGPRCGRRVCQSASAAINSVRISSSCSCSRRRSQSSRVASCGTEIGFPARATISANAGTRMRSQDRSRKPPRIAHAIGTIGRPDSLAAMIGPDFRDATRAARAVGDEADALAATGDLDQLGERLVGTA